MNGGSATMERGDPHHLNHEEGDTASRQATGRGDGGPASKRIIAGYGFWIFLLSDIIMFSGFFAAYAVLHGETAGGPGGAQLFEPGRVALQTGLLLFSSFTCGLGSVATLRRSLRWTQVLLLVTGLLGFAFLALEVQEFTAMVREGAGPSRSAFLSSFFALVGCHGLHVGIGLLWCGTMMAQLWSRGFQPAFERRLLCFNLFWHALDIVWVGVFTIVYLMGASR